MVKTILYISVFLVFCSCENRIKEFVSVSIKNIFFPERLNPAQITKFSEHIIYSQIYETLLQIDKDKNTLQSNLATEWNFSENKLLLRLQLRANVYFHDNSKFSAHSVKKSYEWLISENPSSQLLNMIDFIEVFDSLSVNIHLKYPYSSFLYNLASPFGLNIISENAIDKYKEGLVFHPVGTGPYYLDKWEKSKIIKLRSFEKYWKETGEVNRVVFKSYPKKYGSENALRDEEADLTFPVIGAVTDRLKLTGLIDYKVNPSSNIIYLGFNNARPPFNNVRVREAVKKSININRLVHYAVSGNAIVARGPLPPNVLNYNKFIENEYNLSEAKSLLKQAGYENGLKIRFFFPKAGFTRQTILEFIKTELAKIGITLNVTLFDTWEDFLNGVNSENSQMFIDTWGNDVLGDAENILYSLFSSKSYNNLTLYSNQAVDNLLNKARKEYNYNHRQQIYREIVKEILDDTPAVFLYHMKQHYAYNKHRIKYLPVNTYGIIQFHRIIMN